MEPVLPTNTNVPSELKTGKNLYGIMSGITIEKTKYECSSLPKRWQHQDRNADVLKKTGIQVGKVDVMYYSRGVRNDASLVPPIRQTASIFKQPVTVYKTQESKVKADFKHGVQEKPKQLMWEKRLEGLRACDMDGVEFEGMELPKGLKPVGPNVTDETIIQSVATALHVSAQPVTGQTGSKNALEKNPGVFLDPKQPLVQAVNIADDDIKRQEERVANARRKLQDALKM
ncbi:PREDICTED: methyl-CpG-binding domain protein 3 [Nicrophorus vespilloides]|uniref:Methyl-CpG-binding domain protein 3 n=1 Tax=Nicrophorus vespilloides TaxID=110193 RepID=A0ABM1MM81_NICVS|nr:PREDICTED: methyl-CpG-binding domain protein 3 [Nicrophorus vespilloides]